MDKLNGIRLNLGNVRNDLKNQSAQQKKEDQPAPQAEKAPVVTNQVDPEKVMDAMKKHGIHNLNHVMAQGKVASTSIQEAMDFFTKAITPQMHTDLTEKVKQACAKEFPAGKVHPDVITEVVDNIIFDSLTA